MDSVLLLFILTYFLLLLPSAKSVSDYSSLVYKNCAPQTLSDYPLSESYSQTLDSLFAQLVAQSSQSRFFKTMEIGNDDTAVSGLFQCREDMSGEDCFRCVNMLAQQMSNSLCRHARVQLEGCYTQYDIEGSVSVESNDLVLHKVCGQPSVDTEAYAKYRELLEAAFAALQAGIRNSGYYIGNYESVEMTAQCEGDIDACECSDCVSDAVQVAEEECRSSLSGQIYLAKCFISYIYHPQSQGVKKDNNSTQKLAAIVVGGVAAASLGLLFLVFLKSRWTKGDFD